METTSDITILNVTSLEEDNSTFVRDILDVLVQNVLEIVEHNKVETNQLQPTAITSSPKKSTQKSEPKTINQFLKQNKVTLQQLVIIIKKSRKLYNLCKSRRDDKVTKRVISHKLNRIPLVRFKDRIKLYNTERKNNLKKLARRRCSLEIEPFKINDDVRDKIKEQLELIRNKKKVDIFLIKKPIKIKDLQTDSALIKDIHIKSSSCDDTNKMDTTVNHNTETNKNNKLMLDENEHSSGSVEVGTNITTDSTQKITATENLMLPGVITLSKTTDCTKIKGWRKKQFLETRRTLNLDFSKSANFKPNNFNLNTRMCDVLNERTHPQRDIEQPSCSYPVTTSTEVNTAVSSEHFSVPVRERPILEMKHQFNDARISEDPHQPSCSTSHFNIMELPEMRVKSCSKSAFYSETLDMYLKDAKLNISYEVPKLIAEEAISDVKSLQTLHSSNVQYHSKTPKVKPIARLDLPKKCKAKTLAEKRKMLETDRQRELMHDMEINETSLMKQMRREEKRNRLESIGEIRKFLQDQSIPISRECWATAMKSDSDQSMCQVLKYGNDEIRIAGSSGGPIIHASTEKIAIDDLSTIQTNLDIVIVDETSYVRIIKANLRKHQFSEASTPFRPGPLFRKPFLERKNLAWESVVVPLPKVSLEVQPELNKPMHPHIDKYINDQSWKTGYVSQTWAEFAVQAVNLNQTPAERVAIPLKYKHNQKKTLMRRNKIQELPPEEVVVRKIKLTDSVACEVPLPQLEASVNDTVKQVVDDLLNYLDTPVLDNSNISYCPDCPVFQETSTNLDGKPAPIPDDVHAVLSSKKRNASNRKTERELKRLSVQVIEVDLKRNHKSRMDKKETCTRIECKLGCVCNDSDIEWPQHCGREVCMLECQCRTIKMIDKQKGHHYVTLPEGSDVLCPKTMGQLRDQAKRNLAKEERKFTQTVIKANDQTIVVGEGCRERRKRVTKLPQKYDGFINNSSELKKIHSNVHVFDENGELTEKEMIFETQDARTNIRMWNDEYKPPQMLDQKDQMLLKKESVLLMVNMAELRDVMPWCMVHSLYKCFCSGDTADDIPVQCKKLLSEKCSNEDIDYIEYSSKRSHVNTNPFAAADVSVCARIRGAPNFYLGRNKSQYFRMRNAKIADLESKQPDLLVILMQKYEKNIKKIKQKKLNRNVNSLKEIEIDTGETCTQSETKYLKLPVHISKQLEESVKEKSNSTTGTSKKSKELKTKKNSIPINSVLNGRKRPVIDVAITKPKKIRKSITEEVNKSSPSETNQMKVLEDINPQVKEVSWMKNRLPDVLIPMPHIQNHFRTVVFKCSTYKTIFRLICWNTLCKHYHNNTMFIWYNPNTTGGKLIATKEAGERPSIGFCNVKHINKTTGNLPEIVLSLIQDKLPGKASTAENTYGILVYSGAFWEIRGTILKKPSDGPLAFPDVEENGTKSLIKVRDLPLESKEVPLTVAEPEIPINNKSPTSIRVPIPLGRKDSRWFMLILENDFSILRVAKSQNVIKYGQLKQACEGALKFARTVRFPIPRNVRKKKENTVPTYGVYAVPGLLERVFFGPYGMNEEHGIVTYRYLNGKLVNTQVVDRFYGSQTKKSKGIWLFTKGSAPAELGPDVPIVDLTEKDDDSSSDPGDTRLQDIVDEKDWHSNAITGSNNKFEVLQKAQDEVQMTLVEDCLLTVPVQLPLKRKMPVLERIVDKTSLETPEFVSKMPTLLPIYGADEPARDVEVKSEPPLKRVRNNSDEDDLEIISTTMSSKPRDRNMWLVSEPPNLGYIHLKSVSTGQIILKSPVTKKELSFYTMGDAIEFIDKLLRRCIDFVPSDFQVKMHLVYDKKALLGKRPLREEQLRGFHMICRKGLFDITHLSDEELETMGFSQRERTRILEKKEKLILQKYVLDIGTCFIPSEELRQKNWMSIIHLAPGAIMKFKKENIELKQMKRSLQISNELMCKKYLELRRETSPTNQRNHVVELNKILRGRESDDDDDVVIIEDVKEASRTSDGTNSHLKHGSNATPKYHPPETTVNTTTTPLNTSQPSLKLLKNALTSKSLNINRTPKSRPTTPTSLLCTINSKRKREPAASGGTPCKIKDGKLVFRPESTNDITITTKPAYSKALGDNTKLDLYSQPYPIMLTEVSDKQIATSTVRSPTHILDTATIENAPIYAPVVLPDGRSILVPIETKLQSQNLQVASPGGNQQTNENSKAIKLQNVEKQASSPKGCSPQNGSSLKVAVKSHLKVHSLSGSPDKMNIARCTQQVKKVLLPKSLLKPKIPIPTSETLTNFDSDIIEID